MVIFAELQNGNKQCFIALLVKQDGRLVAGVVEHVDKEQPSADAPASGSLRIDVDVPEKNIHKSTVQRLLPDIRPHQEQQQLNVKRGGSTSSEQEEDVLATVS